MFDTDPTDAPVESRPREAGRLRRALGLEPGVDSLRLLTSIDVSGLSAADRLDFLACMERHDGWLLGLRAAAVIAVAGPVPRPREVNGMLVETDLAESSAQAEVSAALHLSPTASAARIATARFLHAHPEVSAGCARGDLGFGHVAMLERELGAASPEVAALVLGRVLPRSGAQSPWRLRVRVRRELVRVDADAIRRRIQGNARNRSCDLAPEPDLAARITVTGPWSMLAWAHRQFDAWARAEQERLRAQARPVPGARHGCGAASDDRSARPDGHAMDPALSPDADTALSALRADALVEAARLLALAMGSPGTDPVPATVARPGRDSGTDPGVGSGTDCGVATPSPVRGRSWSTAVVLCDLPTALGLAEEPGFVPRYGFVPAAVARELLATADTWRRFLTDGGRLVDTGATRYRPSARLRELVTARDQTCAFPGCPVPATLADLDHTANFDGANTVSANLRPLCRRHHRLKTHHPGWRLRADERGDPQWTSPTGHRYPAPAHPLWDVGATSGTGASAAEDTLRRLIAA